MIENSSPQMKMRLWAINHFRILPTDKRFKKLTDDQVELLFLSSMQLPLEDELRRFYVKKKKEEEVNKQLPEEVLLSMGYSVKEIESIKKDMSVIGERDG